MTLENDQKVDSVKVLGVFNRIIELGEKQLDGSYLLEGLSAHHDHDGYTLTLKDAEVRLDYYFHNKYQLDYESRKQLTSFLRKIDCIYTRHYQTMDLH